jgi:hypothetical protein
MKHRVTFSIPSKELKKADIIFKISNDNGLLGTLEISNGSLVWFPKGKNIGHKAYWHQFNKFMIDKRQVEKK